MSLPRSSRIHQEACAGNPMKVAWFGHKTRKRGNGLVMYSKQFREGLEARRAQVVSFYHGSMDEEIEEDSRHVRLRSLGFWDHDLISSPSARSLIRRTLVDEEVDIAHVSLSFSLLDFSLPQLCHTLGIPIAATFHVPYDRRLSLWGIGSRLLYRLWSIALAKYDAVVIFSQEQRDILAGYGVPVERIHVIPNGVDVDVFRPGPSTYKEEVGAELLMVYCGRLDPEKNVGTLLHTFQSLGLSPSYKAVVVGGGIEYDRLLNLYDGESIIFTGLICDKDKLIRILQAGDIFVLPSNVEGLPIAMLEGMACGMATIATDVGCNAEALGGAGIVIDPDNLQSQLNLALRVLVENPDLRRSLRKKARQRVVSRYSLQHNIDQMTELHQQLIASRK
jgi:glycosyltransferase involved in cell wall biosynthesis